MDEEQKTEPVDLDALERLARKATPGPVTRIGALPCDVYTDEPDGHTFVAEFATAEDAEYYAAIRNAAPDLFAEIRRLRQEVSDLTAERDALESELSSCDCSEV